MNEYYNSTSNLFYNFMGQYHAVFNIDKKECLIPYSFGCGAKIWEWCSGYSPVSKATMMLLACSNGRGGGDFQLTGGTPRWIIRDCDKHYEFQIGNDKPQDGLPITIIKHKKDFYTVDTDKVYGRWSGDRVVVIGDYADDIFYDVKVKLMDKREVTEKIPANLFYSLAGDDVKDLKHKETDKEKFSWLFEAGTDNLWDYYIKKYGLRSDIDLTSLICEDISLPLRLCLEAENSYYQIPNSGFFDEPSWGDKEIDGWEEKDADAWSKINRLERIVKERPSKKFFLQVQILNKLDDNSDAGQIAI